MNRFKLYILLIRPHQWLKNLMLFFPPFLGGALLEPGLWVKGLLPFLAFSCASSAGYINNDLVDCEADRLHPLKTARPLASGLISNFSALILAGALGLLALVCAYFIQPSFLLVTVLYLAISVSYSCCLKNTPVVDLFCIASGFLLRLYAGGLAFNIKISEWLFLSVFLLSLFLSAGKRLSEKESLQGSAHLHRKVLGLYPDGFLDGVLFMTGSAVLVTYTMYTLTHQTLIYTVPLCCFGLLRYIFRVKSGQGGDPTDALLRDIQLFMSGVLWVAFVSWSVYR